MSEITVNPNCANCKCYFIPKIKSSGLKYKTCEKCQTRVNNKKCVHNKQKSRCRECGGGSFCIHDKQKSRCRECGGSALCIHNKQKSQCKDCGGSSICIHDKFKTTCRECGGSSICIHDKFKTDCRECGGSSICIHDKFKTDCRKCSDPLKLTVQRFIRGSKASDKKHNRLDIVNFIDTDFCKLLIDESEYKCCYCKTDVQLIEYTSNLISIERIDNSIGHIKSNVKIACFSCNVKRVGSKSIEV